MEEQWVDIKGYEGLYRVSDTGRVMTIKSGRIRKAFINLDGYLILKLHKEGKRKNFKIHQLVAMGFLGHTPSGMTVVVDHIDNNKLNNRADNLQLVTNRENSSKDRSGGYSKYVGVTWDKCNSKWKSSIYHNRSPHHLGYYKHEEEARDAYSIALGHIQEGLPFKHLFGKKSVTLG